MYGAIPPSALPHEAEQDLLAIMFASRDVVEHVLEHIRPSDFSHATLRKLAQAMWMCITATPPQPLTLNTVRGRLREIGMLDTPDGVSSVLLAEVERQGTDDLVSDMERITGTVQQAAIARRVAGTLERAHAAILERPSEAVTLQQWVRDEIGRLTVRQKDRFHEHRFGAIDAVTPLTEVRGLPTSLRAVDALTGGLVGGHVIGIQAHQKGGKTRAAISLILSSMLNGVPTLVFTTDGSVKDFRNRIVALVASGMMISSGYDSDHANLHPNKLGSNKRSTVQRRFIEQARATLRELPIYAFDVRDGAAEWTDVERHWNRSEREFGSPPRIVMIDHFADMTYKGSQEFHDFNRVLVEAHIRTVSTGATGIWLNQRNEGGNKGKQGRSAGSYGGGKFTAKVDHLIEVNPTNDDQSVLQISFERSRWGAKGDLYYSILKNSGFIVNNAFIPDGVDIYDDDTWRDAA